MIDDALGHSVFATVVVAVAILGIVVALVLAIRRRDAFSEERGELWLFHGEADTSPHQMPGARFEERHVIDPDIAAETSATFIAERSAAAPSAFSARDSTRRSSQAADS